MRGFAIAAFYGGKFFKVSRDPEHNCLAAAGRSIRLRPADEI